MRVAICLSGLSKQCFKQTYRYLPRLFKENCDIHIFAHTWANGNNDEQHEFFTKHYTKYQVESYDTTGNWNILTVDELAKMPQGCKNVCPMFYSIMQANNLKSEFEKSTGKFDLVVRSRFDSLYENHIPVNELHLSKQFENTIFCGWNGYDTGDRFSRNMFKYNEVAAPFVADNFAFGSSKAMDVYSSTYNSLNFFRSLYDNNGKDTSGPIPGPEICLGTHLLNNHVNFFRTETPYKALTQQTNNMLTFSSYYNNLTETTI